MAAPVSRKLSNSFEGALAGGGDPATSPLYVFGPFLQLIVVAGVASVTFGASMWLVILTVAAVSAMYRLVMRWVTDGSGGSGLSEEEFGGWAVKVNAGITFIEYTLTFLVSTAAMVTFIADRLPLLNDTVFLNVQYRTIVAILLSILTGWIVNRGPKVSARVFGPATLGVLILLWAMIVFSIVQRYIPGGSLQGVPLVPSINLDAFKSEYLFKFTLAGYARILAVMTGIEVFANLVAAYQGKPAEKSRKAFGSLIIIMGTTSLTMLIVGPAILALSNVALSHEVSVFTQTMDQLLPGPLPAVGTLVSVLVLLSASAASAQGLQNLALGLKDRHYIPAALGQRNRFDVADWPVWIEVAIVVVCFLFLGTNEELYLSVYAAGVFILLSMTGWATTKRLVRFLRADFKGSRLATLIGVVVAALLTTGATIVIFAERFTEGAWLYVPLIIGLYIFFSYFRRRIGEPSQVMEELGRREEGFYGVGMSPGKAAPVARLVDPADLEPLPASDISWHGQPAEIRKILVTLDSSEFAERALPMAEAICRATGASILLVSVMSKSRSTGDVATAKIERENYLSTIAGRMKTAGLKADYVVAAGSVSQAVKTLMDEAEVDILVMSTRGLSGMGRLLLGSTADAIVQVVARPVLLIRPEKLAPGETPDFNKVIVTLDGSDRSERTLPFAKLLAGAIDGEIILLSVPEVPEPEIYGSMQDAVTDLRRDAETKTWRYLKAVAAQLDREGVTVRPIVTGSRPATTIVEVAQREQADLVMLATRGHVGIDRLVVGSVADRVIRQTTCPVFLVPVREKRSSD